MSEDRITQVFSVRDRPVGFVSGRWGGALVAIERGYFPVSQTGYRSLCSMGGDAVTTDFLESLARERDRERRELLRRVRSAVQPEPDRIVNYVHVSMAAEKALHDGFFAPDAERAELWPAAHRLFGLIDTDARFQPTPDHSCWTTEHCANALARTREAQHFLECCAKGDFPAEVPVSFFAARAYLALPPKPQGEPTLALAGLTPELGLEMTATTATKARVIRPSTQGAAADGIGCDHDTQLGLFGGDDGAATVRLNPGGSTQAQRRSRRGISN